MGKYMQSAPNSSGHIIYMQAFAAFTIIIIIIIC